MSRPPAPYLLRRLISTWPPPTPALWLTGTASLGCVLALRFSHEIWTSPKPAERWLLALLCLLGLAAIWQTLGLLWHWLAGYAGPRWLALLLRLGLLSATVAAVLPAMVLLALALLGIFNPTLD